MSKRLTTFAMCMHGLATRNFLSAVPNTVSEDLLNLQIFLAVFNSYMQY